MVNEVWIDKVANALLKLTVKALLNYTQHG